MIITTTPTVEGRRITEYKGIVFGEVIAGVNVVKDIAASFSNFFGGRSGTYETELINAREQAIHELEQRALQLNADAVVAVDVDYEVLGADNGMLMVTASGTAVSENLTVLATARLNALFFTSLIKLSRKTNSRLIGLSTNE